MSKNTGFLSKYLPFIVTGLVLAVVFYIRVRLLTMPLERDEGEFAYIGQLLLKGISPFSHAYTMKLPGVGMMYALFMFLFGQTPAAIHAGLLIVNGACVYLVYLLAKRLFDGSTALFSCASYAMLSLSSGVYGVSAHATHFVLLFALAGYLMLHIYIANRRFLFLLSSGLCFGLAFIMKQHAALLMFFALLYYVWCAWRNPLIRKKKGVAGVGIFLLGVIIPYAVILLWMVKAGSFSDFWFWTVQYAREYAANPPLVQGWDNLTNTFGLILKLQFPLWLLAGFGCILLGLKKKYCADRLFVFGLLLFSFVAICPGLLFREHYFVLILPAVAIMAGAGISSIGAPVFPHSSRRFAETAPAVMLLAAIMYCLYLGKDYYFVQNPLEVCRTVYGVNPFPEAQHIARYLKNNTSSSDSVAVLGSEPEIYFYADRLSATGHIYMYGLMENQPYAERMQMQMIREIEASQPKFVVVVNVYQSWLVRGASNKSVLDWAGVYVQNKYDQVGVIDIIDQKTTRYYWDDKATDDTPVTGTYLTVHKRKDRK